MSIDDFNYEMQLWIEKNPRTKGDLEKFYKSMVSIHLGGKGLMRLFNEAKTHEERRNVYTYYETNYPDKEDK